MDIEENLSFNIKGLSKSRSEIWTPLDLVLGKNSCFQDLSVCLSLIFDLCWFLEGPLKILETLILVIRLTSRKHYILSFEPSHFNPLCFLFQEKVSTCKMTITKMRVVGFVMRVFVVQLTNKSVEIKGNIFL